MPNTQNRTAGGADGTVEESGQVKTVLSVIDDVVSCPGSRVSTRKFRSSTSVAAKRAVLVAELIERQLIEELRLKWQYEILKRRNAVELAKLKLKFSMTEDRMARSRFDRFGFHSKGHEGIDLSSVIGQTMDDCPINIGSLDDSKCSSCYEIHSKDEHTRPFVRHLPRRNDCLLKRRCALLRLQKEYEPVQHEPKSACANRDFTIKHHELLCYIEEAQSNKDNTECLESEDGC